MESIPSLMAVAALFLLAQTAARATTTENMTHGHIYIQANGHSLEVSLSDGSSSRALVAELEKGDIDVKMTDYGNFEKVGRLPRSFPRNDAPIDTVPGDVILYQGDKLCIYYGTNSWDFTRLGKITLPAAEFKKALGKGAVTVTLTLDNAH